MDSELMPMDPKVRRLQEKARSSRDRAKGRTVSFSPKVFIPLTRLCRDRCGYCVYRQSPAQADRIFLVPQEVLDIARKGEALGCREALFVLGERPEERYAGARAWLGRRGFRSSLEYLGEVCGMLLRETALLPHSNPGTLSPSELTFLKPVNASMGLMMEILSDRLCGPGGPHEHAPSKHPRRRLETLVHAGELGIPFTTGLLIGIGETRQERVRTLETIERIHRRYGHVQEVIVQNFRPKPGTPMASCPSLSHQEMLETLALARTILGGEMNLQAPPNLALQEGYLDYLEWGINDWGGISPLTLDYVNPEAPWPHLQGLKRRMSKQGYRLKARYPVYPGFIRGARACLPDEMARRIEGEADPHGYVPDQVWRLAGHSRQPTPEARQAVLS